MKNVFLIIIFSAAILSAQSFRAEQVEGQVTAQIGTSENWTIVNNGQFLPASSTVSTSKNSQVWLQGNNINLLIKGSSAVKLTSIKKMTVNELILALAMEDMLNAPKKNENLYSKNTAVYGAEVNGIKPPIVESDNFGIKRLNGAVQLAESGLKESAVVFARETFRKYPETNSIAAFRIYFANILYNLGLNEDAYDDFKTIRSLKLTDVQKEEVRTKMDTLAKKLLRN